MAGPRCLDLEMRVQAARGFGEVVQEEAELMHILQEAAARPGMGKGVAQRGGYQKRRKELLETVQDSWR